MTVKELRAALKGLPGNMEVYTADHDHGKFEVNAPAGEAEVINKKDAEPWDLDHLYDIEKEEFESRPNKYLVIRP